MNKIIYNSKILKLIASVSSQKEDLMISLENNEQDATTIYYHEKKSEDRADASILEPP